VATTTPTTRPSSPSTDEFSRRDIEFHREIAGAYDDEVTQEFAVYHERLLEPFLERVAARHPGGRALDLGCGTGVVTLALARRGFDVVGVDHSPDMLEIGRRKLAAAGVAATLVTGDVRALPFRDGEFACVTVQGLLHHLEGLEPCLREAVRVLAPAGFLYVSEPTRDPTPLKRLLVRLWSALPRARPVPPEPRATSLEQPISIAELRRTLERLGLSSELRLLTHLPPLRRRLPDAVYIALSRALTFPWRRRRGDLVFVYAEKRS
jgi:ubiquinone/menaquinone biosynthesis C-methylase UbiE